MDELAEALGTDPIELRVRNEPDVDPDSGMPFSSRNLVACLREGARRFGWSDRDPRPATREEDDWLVGAGVASSVYPVNRNADSTAVVRVEDDRYDRFAMYAFGAQFAEARVHRATGEIRVSSLLGVFVPAIVTEPRVFVPVPYPDHDWNNPSGSGRVGG
jgi:CO/xanthine dehydrogenase Mo-binding subunit